MKFKDNIGNVKLAYYVSKYGNLTIFDCCTHYAILKIIKDKNVYNIECNLYVIFTIVVVRNKNLPMSLLKNWTKCLYT